MEPLTVVLFIVGFISALFIILGTLVAIFERILKKED